MYMLLSMKGLSQDFMYVSNGVYSLSLPLKEGVSKVQKPSFRPKGGTVSSAKLIS